MPYKPQMSIEGIQEVQENNLRRIAALQPEGKAGEAVRDALVALHRYAVSITHVGIYNGVGGGSLRAAHRVEVEGIEGQIYIDPSARNPRTNKKPAEYGIYEHARGGEHAFYDRTVSEVGPTITEKVKTEIKDAVIYAK